MAFLKISNYGVSDVNFTALMNTADKQRPGYINVNLDSSNNIAANSSVEVGGALYLTTSTVIPTGSGAYLKVIPSGASSMTAERTSTAPTWDAEKGGYYGTGASATHRYIAYFNGSVLLLYGRGHGDAQTLRTEKSCEMEVYGMYELEDDNILRFIQYPIGTWDMDTVGSRTFGAIVSSGLPSPDKILSISAVIYNDAENKTYDLCHIDSSFAVQGRISDYFIGISGGGFTLERRSGGVFDSTDFNSTSINRGWVYIVYYE